MKQFCTERDTQRGSQSYIEPETREIEVTGRRRGESKEERAV